MRELAGGLGFEPRLAESESAVLPLDDPPAADSALGVLSCATSLATADLLTLDLARIARHEARLPQWLAQRLIISDQRPGDAVTDRAGLAGDAAAGDLDRDVERRGHLHQLQRLPHDHSSGLATEEFIDRTLVDRDTAIAGLQMDARRGALAPAGAVIRGCWHNGFLILRALAVWAAARCADAYRRRTRAACGTSVGPAWSSAACLGRQTGSHARGVP